MAYLRLEMSEAKLELNGSEELIKNESTRFYYALGVDTLIDCKDDKQDGEGVPVTQAFSAGECALSFTQKVPAKWGEIIDSIKCGQWKPNIGDMVSCKLKDDRKVDFVVTDITDDAVRFESLDCLGEKVKHTELDKYCNRIFDLLPDELKEGIMSTERRWLDKDGNLKTRTYKLFVPSCSEVAPEDECIGDKGVYKQLDWYKDRRHRIRCDEKGGDTCWWWTISAYSGNSTLFVLVNYNGSVNYSASNAIGAPVCFQIPKS